MAYTLTITTGTAAAAQFQSNGYNVIGAEGLGMAQSQRIETQAALQHGITDHGFFLLPRIFSIRFPIAGASFDGLYTGYEWFNYYMRPMVTPIRLLWEFDAGRGDFQIDAVLLNGVSMSTQDESGFSARVTGEFKAGNPTFYNPVLSLVSFGLSGGGGAFDVPLAVPVGVGASALDQTITVEYAGTWQTSPIVYIYGPITDPVIENETTGEKLDFTGTTIADGDHYIVNTRYGIHTVIDNNDVDKIDDLTDDSDLGTFHLDPDPIVSGGNNDITVTGTGVDTATEVKLQYYERFLALGSKIPS